MSTHNAEKVAMLTDAEKRLRDWLMTHPEGGEMWCIVKGGFRRSYGHGVADLLAEAERRQFAPGGAALRQDNGYVSMSTLRAVARQLPAPGPDVRKPPAEEADRG